MTIKPHAKELSSLKRTCGAAGSKMRDIFEYIREKPKGIPCNIQYPYIKEQNKRKEIEKTILLSTIKKYKIMQNKPNPVSV